MVHVRYIVVNGQDLTDRQKELVFYYDGYDDFDNYIFKVIDGTVKEYVSKDGGEPEDQFLYKYWGWVVPELNAAYEEGRKHQFHKYKEMKEAMQEFVERCEKGEARSTYTYNKFKDILAK